MGIVDIFSKRQKRLRGEVPDVYTYDKLPKAFLIQVKFMLSETIGGPNEYDEKIGGYARAGYNYPHVRRIYDYAYDTLCREFGICPLVLHSDEPCRDLFRFLRETYSLEDTEAVLSAIELLFYIASHEGRHCYILEKMSDEISSQNVDLALEELNARFQEHGLGYRFENDQIIRIDSEYIHSEAVKPALVLLSHEDYAGANDEFLNGHEHYRQGNYKEAANDCLKAIESTLKIICNKQSWTHKNTDTASRLFDICIENQLIPSFWNSGLNALRQLLISSVPTARNKTSAHGQGGKVTDIPLHVASYMIHMTASTIVMLVEAEKAYKPPHETKSTEQDN